MNPSAIKAKLREWLEATQALEAELSRPEPDETVLQTLLARRQSLQEELALLAPAGPTDDPELRSLAQACVDCDRRALEKAQHLHSAAAQSLAEVKARRQAAAGYWGALVDTVRSGPAFVDGRV